MSKITEVRHVVNEKVAETDDGEPILERVDRWEYEFSKDATEWEKEAVREYGCTSKDEFDDAIAWRDVIDEMDNQQAARVMRGKHPKDDSKEIGRPKNLGNRPDHDGPS